MDWLKIIGTGGILLPVLLIFLAAYLFIGGVFLVIGLAFMRVLKSKQHNCTVRTQATLV